MGRKRTAADYTIRDARPDKRLAAPRLAYKPLRPTIRLSIGVIGCGGVSSSHFNAYRKARYRVTALADLDRARAERQRDTYFPRARVYDSAEQLLRESDVEVVDLATHAEQRSKLIQAALEAGKHVLSQKPFVTDLRRGKELVELARAKRLKLAVNQNGRWAPHVSYARQAIAAGLLGEVQAADLAVHWNHNWCAGTPFDHVHHLALFDFGIHWFDMIRCYIAALPEQVFAQVAVSPHQSAQPPLLAQATVQFPGAQASLILRGDTRCGPSDRTVIVGNKGTLVSEGPNLNQQTVRIFWDHGYAEPRLTTHWFDDGFEGAMAELLSAIQESREPAHSAADNLQTLALCFAALSSADSGRPRRPGTVRRLPAPRPRETKPVVRR